VTTFGLLSTLALAALAYIDTLGIGSFAPTTAYFKLRARMPDEEIPGTLNAGQALPTLTQALIFIATVSVDSITLISMIIAAVLGAWLGVGLAAYIVKSLPIIWLRWLVLALVLYAAFQMLRSARRQA
jgi:uncharacterized membrane protein YfcA